MRPIPGVSARLVEQFEIGVARGCGAFLVGAIGEQRRLGRPGEQHRDAAELGVHHDLRQTEARLLQRSVEAVDIDQHVAIGRRRGRRMRGDLFAEFFLVQLRWPARGRNDGPDWARR